MPWETPVPGTRQPIDSHSQFTAKTPTIRRGHARPSNLANHGLLASREFTVPLVTNPQGRAFDISIDMSSFVVPATSAMPQFWLLKGPRIKIFFLNDSGSSQAAIDNVLLRTVPLLLLIGAQIQSTHPGPHHVYGPNTCSSQYNRTRTLLIQLGRTTELCNLCHLVPTCTNPPSKSSAEHLNLNASDIRTRQHLPAPRACGYTQREMCYTPLLHSGR